MKGGPLDMALTVDEIREKYAAILEREDTVRGKLADTRAKLKTAREADAAATAEAALAGEPAPKRTEVTLRHQEENLEVELQGLDEAVWTLQQEARRAVGEGRDFPIWIPPNAPATRAEVVAEWKAGKERQDGESDEDFEARVERTIPRSNVDAESIIAEAHRQRGLSLDRRLPRLTERPADLIAWVEAAYAAEDRQAEAGYEAHAAKQRMRDAVAAVERAKGEHLRRGLPAGSFNPRMYPDIVLPEHLAQFGDPIERSPFQKVRDQLPSYEEEQNRPVAEPQPVNEADELRKREIAGVVPPTAAPDVTPITQEAA
jgi:hypothetical protein